PGRPSRRPAGGGRAVRARARRSVSQAAGIVSRGAGLKNRPKNMTATTPVALDYVSKLAPYIPGKPIEDVARELHLDPATIVKLASNENPRGPSPKVLAAIAAAAVEVTRYPDGFGYHLKDALGKRLAV